MECKALDLISSGHFMKEMDDLFWEIGDKTNTRGVSVLEAAVKIIGTRRPLKKTTEKKF